MNYYNEFDPRAAAWLRELIKAGEIPAGDVDERSITDVKPNDLTRYTQCHFFAGIGGWSYALRLARWPDTRPVWTGSCPCQPFSAAGKGLGEADPRHLWPQFARLIGQCKPATVFGEQVASKAGREWLSRAFFDLEGMGYAAAGADLCAASVSAPHIRQRLFWVADSQYPKRRAEHQEHRESHRGNGPGGGRDIGGLADSETASRDRAELRCDPGPHSRILDGMEHATSDGREQRRAESSCGSVASGRRPVVVGYADKSGLQECGSEGQRTDSQPEPIASSDAGRLGEPDSTGRDPRGQAGQAVGCGNSIEPTGAWSNYELLPCTDGKKRRIESGSFPLASGVPGRVGLLRGYGNAIVPQVAAEFIQAFTDSEELTA